MDETTHSPAPWSFHSSRYGFSNVVVDARGRVIAANLIPADGELIAAAPGMLEFLRNIAQLTGGSGETFI